MCNKLLELITDNESKLIVMQFVVERGLKFYVHVYIWESCLLCVAQYLTRCENGRQTLLFALAKVSSR